MKKYIPLIFTAAFPYYIVGILCGMFVVPAVLDTGVADLSIFILLIPVVFLFGLTGSIVFAVLCLTKKLDLSIGRLAKVNMVIKLAQVPAYALIFVMGVLCLITIFTIGISIVLAILDYMAICLTGIVGMTAVVKSRKEGVIDVKWAVVLGICQFIFCVDIIAAIILYKKVKREKENGSTNEKTKSVEGI